MRYERSRDGATVMQSEAEAVAERISGSSAALNRALVLMRQVTANMAMLPRCATPAAENSLIRTILDKSSAIDLLLARCRGELASAPWHLEAESWGHVSHSILDLALRRATISYETLDYIGFLPAPDAETAVA